MQRYGSIEFTKKLSFKELIKIINKAFEEKEKAELYQMYLALLPNFDKKSFMTFAQFYRKYGSSRTNNVVLDKRTDEEVLDELIKKHSIVKE